MLVTIQCGIFVAVVMLFRNNHVSIRISCINNLREDTVDIRD